MAMRISKQEFMSGEMSAPPDPEVIAERVTLEFEVSVFKRMEALGLRQKDLAKMLGVTPATISKTLSGTSNMTLKTAARIANALGCDLAAPLIKDPTRMPNSATITVSYNVFDSRLSSDIAKRRPKGASSNSEAMITPKATTSITHEKSKEMTAA